MSSGAKPSSFIAKFHSILKNKSYEEVIKYDQSKAKIIIFDKIKLQKDILPRFFRHGKLTSFIRQLNLYGFKKMKDSEVECFTHPNLENKQKFLSIIAKKKVIQEQQYDPEQNSLNQPDNNQQQSSQRLNFNIANLHQQSGALPLVQFNPIQAYINPLTENYMNLSMWNSLNFQDKGLMTVFMPITTFYPGNSYNNFPSNHD